MSRLKEEIEEARKRIKKEWAESDERLKYERALFWGIPLEVPLDVPIDEAIKLTETK